MTKSTYLFIESLSIQDMAPLHLKWHQARVNNTFAKYFPTQKPFILNNVITPTTNLLQKCRITYSNVIVTIEYEPFVPKNIQSLKIVRSEPFDYAFKFADRVKINSLREQRESADDILISINKFITDSSFTNVVFYDGQQYYTPENPLLSGTKRAQLLEKKTIKPILIKETDIPKFKEVHLINALVDLGDYVIKPENIFKFQ